MPRRHRVFQHTGTSTRDTTIGTFATPRPNGAGRATGGESWGKRADTPGRVRYNHQSISVTVIEPPHVLEGKMAPPPAVNARARLRGAALVFAALFGAAVLEAQERPPTPAPESPKSAAEPSKAATHSLDGAKLPPGAVIIVTDKPADALRNVNAVVISAEEY